MKIIYFMILFSYTCAYRTDEISLTILKQENKLLKFLGFMWNPLSWVMEAAAIMAIVLANGGVFLFLKSTTI